MTLLSSWDDNSLPTASNGSCYNDIWGYASEGREYAILGSAQGTNVIDITVPTNPQHIAFEPGGSSNSIWRDYKTFRQYLYAVSDQGAGSSLQIFDLSGLPSAMTKVYDSQALFTTAHNLFVDSTSGHLYVAGSSAQAAGILILDIATDPANPTLLANFNLGAYTHDLFVMHDTCYAFMGNQGWAVFDFANLAAPAVINFVFFNTYPESGYAHSGWATPDFNYLYWCDETHNMGVHIGNVSDPANITFHPTFRSTLQGPTFTNSVPHNAFVKGNQLYVSYYHDGVQVFDITDPTAPVRSAYYDTYPANTDYTGLRGCWGIYPFLPSGNVIASDVTNGLFVLQETNIFPVTLANFRADERGDRVRLRWSTYSETNNEAFAVERSEDGKDFRTVVTIPGAGNHLGELAYEAFDDRPLEGISYYRLRQTDFDGSTTFSDVRTINRGMDLSLLDVYPSPASRQSGVKVRVALEKTQDVQLRVTNLMGQLVHEDRQELGPGMHTMELPCADWARGAYHVLVQGKNALAEQKLVLAD